MKIQLTVELTEKELAAALLPNGGKVTEVVVDASPTRKRRASTATTQKATAPKKEPAKKGRPKKES
jgi:hypothetical protein